MTATAAGSMWQRFAAAVVRPLRRQRLRREHEWLDSAAYRDLGLSRSELSSFQAEAAGIAARTRRRCADLAFAGAMRADLVSLHDRGARAELEHSR
jgi:hypothetical protein